MGSVWARVTERIADSHPEISVSLVGSESGIFLLHPERAVLSLEIKDHALGKRGEREYNSGAGGHASIQLGLTELYAKQWKPNSMYLVWFGLKQTAQ